VVSGVETLRGTLAVNAGAGSGTVSMANGTQVLRVSFTDSAGNVGFADVNNITITDDSCDLLVAVPVDGTTAVGGPADAFPASSSTVEVEHY
jgi:hypothetical protein